MSYDKQIMVVLGVVLAAFAAPIVGAVIYCLFSNKDMDGY